MFPYNASTVRRDAHVAAQITLLIGLLTLLIISLIQTPPELGWLLAEIRHANNVHLDVSTEMMSSGDPARMWAGAHMMRNGLLP
jgi:hypothetical protein